jgi:signal transduction histidine kinase
MNLLGPIRHAIGARAGSARAPAASRRFALGGAGVFVASTVAGYARPQGAGGRHVTTPAPAALALAVGLLGCLIVWQKPWHRLGVAMTGTAAGFAVAVLGCGLLDYGALRGGVPRAVEHAAYAWVWATGALVAAWALVILWFPDGRFPTVGWRRFFVVSSALTIPFVIACYLFIPGGQVYALFSGIAIPPGIEGPLANQAWHPLVGRSEFILLVPLIAVVGLVQRYRRSDPVVRQQIKWLVVGAALGVAAQIVAVPFNLATGSGHLVGEALGVAGQPLMAAGITVGILRYRLWEIDLVVSRALVFAVVWSALSVLLLVPALAAGLLVGGTSAVTAVALALLVTLLFRPTTRRLEEVVARLVYRRRMRPHAVLTGFWQQLRHLNDLNDLADLLVETVCRDIRVNRAQVWIASAVGLRRLGSRRTGNVAVVALSSETTALLRASPGVVLAGEPPAELAAIDPTGALVPLVAGDELVGLLACGQRRGDPLAAADFELLDLLARESAQRLRNLRLEASLRERLAEIEAQAGELRRSRQRLVGVQDEERRRIERNLHDGVQQQLVSLAIRLKQAASVGDPTLADLAGEAEQAVFSLQELARGIFPGVLVDQGLAAALRTQAARMPMTVHIDVRPEALRLRPPAHVEAALYFVALEALTNAQKHAGSATASVLLRVDEGCLVLEVADDGPGFGGRQHSGSGLQNMADRIAAVGGSLDVDSSPGRGTRVVASVPNQAVVRLPDPRRRQAPEADSRK